ncbi:MAG: hypothetical protein IJC31_08995 [Spirochaetaceae bacterium]|nr:hypothetical protein [Spirochaetaceae bacterium]
MEMKFPQTKFQQVVFALLTVFLTGHCFVYYSLFVVNGEFLMAATGASTVLAAFLYYPHHADFSLLEVLVFWTRLLCVNFPFALFMQVFLIQPVVRRLFRCLFR